MKVDSYAVMQRAVEEGVARGYRRAHKHTDTPGEEAIRDAIEDAVMGELCEWFIFADEEGDTDD